MPRFVGLIRDLSNDQEHFKSTREEINKKCKTKQMELRKTRIERKTAIRPMLEMLTLNLRESIRTHSRTLMMSPLEMYAEFDINGDNSIDQIELYEVNTSLNLGCTS